MKDDGRCKICGKRLSTYNHRRGLCFLHQKGNDPEKENKNTYKPYNPEGRFMATYLEELGYSDANY